MTYRVWLEGCRWILVSAENQEAAMKALTRTQRRKFRRITPLPVKENKP